MHPSLARLRDWFSPRGCLACDDYVPPWVAFCATCVLSVERRRSSTKTKEGLFVHSPFVYGGALSDAIVRLKFHHRGDLAAPLSELVASAWQSESWFPEVRENADALVAVPSSPERARERGFNPPALVAITLARRWGVSHHRLLGRAPSPSRQVGLSREQRLENAKGAFYWRGPARPDRARVVLVDDVVTTGATLDACALALSPHVDVVFALTIAVAERGS